jgi:hypothetical protein
VVEHDLDLIASADWTIELGPGGRDASGQIIATGTPADAFPRQGEGPAGACQFWAGTMLMASRSASGSAVTLIGFPGLPVATVIGVSVLLPLPTT